MLQTLIKAALSGVLVMIVAETSKRSPAFGALVASLPLISILAVIWLWNDTGDTVRVANHLEATFYYVLPSLPIFLVMPALLRAEYAFWPALGLSVLLTIALYSLVVVVAARFGIQL
ncbi:hypothetical protein BN1012_Phect2870 [Candidatus Phaeomarinobacter ectocarpi]|uniref:DUF3147 family protein n=1 Tax=Candidatus Phaeomarinibacter ectocarpi TaxID=1458461 RepID=X5MEQ4_9HYPH|nr:DUF3147 family protein [Candidatus Phaeomarinobacter ectocarpi]CDO61082.1 hypothetical protein BN1012_Phect2870 [Candidatus Phaeomarinobacter ectocarpi]